LIDINGLTATAETYFIAHAIRSTGGDSTAPRAPYETKPQGEKDRAATPQEASGDDVCTVTMLLGRYLDRLDKGETGWKIRVRKVVIDWGSEYSQSFNPAVLENFHRSKWFPHDVVYRMSDLRVPGS
jgi:hypothetical protein